MWDVRRRELRRCVAVARRRRPVRRSAWAPRLGALAPFVPEPDQMPLTEPEWSEWKSLSYLPASCRSLGSTWRCSASVSPIYLELQVIEKRSEEHTSELQSLR